MITSSSLPLPLGIQLIFRCIIMEAHGNIEAAAATEHGSESQLIELLSEDAGQTGEYELPLESDAVEPPSKKVKLTLTTSAAAEHASPDRTATEHASPDGTATEHASTWHCYMALLQSIRLPFPFHQRRLHAPKALV